MRTPLFGLVDCLGLVGWVSFFFLLPSCSQAEWFAGQMTLYLCNLWWDWMKLDSNNVYRYEKLKNRASSLLMLSLDSRRPSKWQKIAIMEGWFPLLDVILKQEWVLWMLLVSFSCVSTTVAKFVSYGKEKFPICKINLCISSLEIG